MTMELESSKVFKSDMQVPKFATEAEEAKWWFENQDKLLEEFKKATAEGRVGIGTVAKRAALRTTTIRVTIRLDPEDIAKARVQAAKCGLRHQTYLKMIIHEALHRKVETCS